MIRTRCVVPAGYVDIIQILERRSKMYRLHYEVRGGFWCIQFEKFCGLYWSTVKSPDGKPTRFETLDETTKYASESGIAKHYRQQLPYESPASRFDGRNGNGYQPFPYEQANGRM